jgi:hypothetical protein
MDALVQPSEVAKPAGASRRLAGQRWAAAVAILAATTVLAAGCGGGGSHTAAAGPGPGPGPVQQLAVFAQCMRSHGEPNFYLANPQSSPSSTGPVLTFMGHRVTGVDLQSAQFAAARKACAHLLPAAAQGGTVPRQQLNRELKSAACMRAHGYPAYPDPKVQNGADWQQLPAGIDTSSPRFQAAAKACGAGGGGG